MYVSWELFIYSQRCRRKISKAVYIKSFGEIYRFQELRDNVSFDTILHTKIHYRILSSIDHHVTWSIITTETSSAFQVFSQGLALYPTDRVKLHFTVQFASPWKIS